MRCATSRSSTGAVGRALRRGAVPRRAQGLECVEPGRRRSMIDEVVQLVVGHPHRSTEMFGLRRRHRGRADAVGEHPRSEQRQVAELAQQDDVVDRLDRAQPVDELVEIEAVDRYRSSLGCGEAGEQLSSEQQPRRRIGELEQWFDIEHREPAARPCPLVDPVGRQQFVRGVVGEHSEEQQRRHGDDLGARAVQHRSDHLRPAQDVVGVPRPMFELVTQHLAVGAESTRQHGDIPVVEIQVLACDGVTSRSSCLGHRHESPS